jgi:alpha-mannosidase
LVLRNEFCEVTVSAKTGGVQSIYTTGYRGNRLSQQLALRRPGKRPATGEAWQSPSETATYSTMSADSVEVSRSGPSTGEIVSRGRLLIDSEPVAEYCQRMCLDRGIPILWLDMEVKPLVELASGPWEHYFASRVAWPDEWAALVRGVGMVAETTEAERLEAPDYIDIRSGNTRTTLLPGGLPYHRRAGARELDTLLIVRGESVRRFTIGIGLDLSHPAAATQQSLSPPLVHIETAPPPTSPTAWLFHIDARNVVATHWEPVATDDARVRGVRLRLLETAGRGVCCGLHAFRPIKAARRLDFTGGPLGELQPSGEKVIIDMAAGQWTQLELEWG